MKYLILAIIALAIVGCATRSERAQHAADADSALQAVSMDLADMVPGLKQLAGSEKWQGVAVRDMAIITGARAYIAPAADVPHADWPKPAQAPAEIQADAGAALTKNAPPEPTGIALLAVLATSGLALLYGVARVAPNLPGAGTLVGGIANLAWGLLAHRDQKAADQAQVIVTTAAADLQPIAGALVAASVAGQLPPSLAPLVTPAVITSLQALADPTLHATAAGV